MIRILLSLLGVTVLPLYSFAQTVVFDQGHFNIVQENGTARLAAEATYNNDINRINNSMEDVKLNASAVIVIQDMVLKSLSQVDQGLKSAIAVEQIATLSAEIVAESGTLVDQASDNPQLLLLTEEVANQLKNRSVNLLSEVSSFVLKEGENVLMDFEKRNTLLRKISNELKVIRALLYSMNRSLYWANFRSLFRTLNPYQSFVNQDVRLSENIVANTKFFIK